MISISDLVARFEHYAINLKEIAHLPGDRRNNAFMHLDIESLQDAVSSGIKFPALFIQTPDVEKASVYDNISEQYNFTFIILLKKTSTKAVLIDSAKAISDKIYNRLMLDTNSGLIPGVLPGSDEGIFGPMSDELYGWAKSMSINDGYDGEVNQTDWEDEI